MSPIRLPSWREVFDGPWALRLRSGAAGAWLLRGEAEDVQGLDCRFVAGVAARTTADALAELASALELEEVPRGWHEVARVVRGGPVALLVLDAHLLLEEEPGQLAGLVGALKSASEQAQLRVIFQARDLPLEAEAVLAEFGVAEIGPALPGPGRQTP